MFCLSSQEILQVNLFSHPTLSLHICTVCHCSPVEWDWLSPSQVWSLQHPLVLSLSWTRLTSPKCLLLLKHIWNSRVWSGCEYVSVFPALRSGWALPPSWSWYCLLCLRRKDYSWSSSSYNSRDRWVFVCIKQQRRKQRPRKYFRRGSKFIDNWHGLRCVVHHKYPEQPDWSTLSLLDPFGAQHWNVWWDARHDASCTWQDVRDRKDQRESESGG